MKWGAEEVAAGQPLLLRRERRCEEMTSEMRLDDAGEPLQALLSVGGKDSRRLCMVERLPIEVAKHAACFFEYERGGSKVPWRELILEVELAQTHRQVAQFRGRRTEAADVVTLHVGFEDNVVADLGVLFVIKRKGGTHDALGKWAFRHFELLGGLPRFGMMQESAFAFV